MNIVDIIAEVKSADMVLVGLGEEFDGGKRLKDSAEYVRGKETLKESGYHWLQPAWNEFCNEKIHDDNIKNVLEKLAFLLEDKNYFVVSTATNKTIAGIPWKKDRLVMPCGSSTKKQCKMGCSEVIENVNEEDEKLLKKYF